MKILQGCARSREILISDIIRVVVVIKTENIPSVIESENDVLGNDKDMLITFLCKLLEVIA